MASLDITGQTVIINEQLWMVADTTFHNGMYAWLERPDEDGKGNVAIIRPVGLIRRAIELQGKDKH